MREEDTSATKNPITYLRVFEEMIDVYLLGKIPVHIVQEYLTALYAAHTRTFFKTMKDTKYMSPSFKEVAPFVYFMMYTLRLSHLSGDYELPDVEEGYDWHAHVNGLLLLEKSLPFEKGIS